MAFLVSRQCFGICTDWTADAQPSGTRQPRVRTQGFNNRYMPSLVNSFLLGCRVYGVLPNPAMFLLLMPAINNPAQVHVTRQKQSPTISNISNKHRINEYKSGRICTACGLTSLPAVCSQDENCHQSTGLQPSQSYIPSVSSSATRRPAT